MPTIYQHRQYPINRLGIEQKELSVGNNSSDAGGTDSIVVDGVVVGLEDSGGFLVLHGVVDMNRFLGAAESVSNHHLGVGRHAATIVGRTVTPTPIPIHAFLDR